jgi:hypothetical protein
MARRGKKHTKIVSGHKGHMGKKKHGGRRHKGGRRKR